jgi:hypothetical protein
MPISPSSLIGSDPTTWSESEPQWRLIYADRSGNNLADVSASTDRQFRSVLNQPVTIQFKLSPLDPAAPKVLQYPLGLIKVYKRRTLVTVAETSTIQVAGQGTDRSIVVVGTEAPWVRLQKRFIGQGASGVTYTSLDRGEIARRIVTAENARGDLGIRPGLIVPSSTATAGPWYVKQAAEAISELGSPLNGFDLWFEPKDPLDAPTGVHSYMHIAPVRGGFREHAVFEYGTGRANLREYGWQIDNTALINNAISVPGAYPDNLALTLISAGDFGSAIVYGLREDVVENDLVDTSLRTALVQEHVAVRKDPRNLYTFQPHYDDLSGRVPAFPFDYNVGDIVTARVNDANVLQLSGQVRVYGVEVNLPDESGSEEVTLTVVDEG